MEDIAILVLLAAVGVAFGFFFKNVLKPKCMYCGSSYLSTKYTSERFEVQRCLKCGGEQRTY